MIVLDTSGIVALANQSDVNHAAARHLLTSLRDSLMVPSVILSEIAYVLTRRAGERAFVRFLDSLVDGSVLWYNGENDLVRTRELMVRYANLPLGFADAAVVAAAESNNARVLTFDHRHFNIVARERPISIIP